MAGGHIGDRRDPRTGHRDNGLPGRRHDAEEITADYPTVTVAGVRAAAAYRAALAREDLLPRPQPW